MKKSYILILSILSISMLLSACSAAKPTVTTNDPKEILEKIIVGQHTLDFILKEKRSADEWDKLIDRMIGYGCSINAQQKEIIINWLVEQQK